MMRKMYILVLPFILLPLLFPGCTEEQVSKEAVRNIYYKVQPPGDMFIFKTLFIPGPRGRFLLKAA